jgi:UDPglucose 6-dehydrogenase
MDAEQAKQRAPIAVIGLWHLGSVTAACLADTGERVIGIDPDTDVVRQLRNGRPPVSEPGLAALLARNTSRLAFTSEPRALQRARCAWVTFDTPVDHDDNADVEWVLARSAELLAELAPNALVVVSSQLPVGSVAQLRARCAAKRGEQDLRFACVPENLRLGEALESFRAPERIVAGIGSAEDRHELAELLAPFSEQVQWMRVESAEMTKHALNGFLATSVAFINEIAAICESVGADAQEVSRGLKSERRIGPRAYLLPGDAFAGGTLARDIRFLRELATRGGLSAHVSAGVAQGNGAHKHWMRRKLLELLVGAEPGGDGPDARALAGRRVAIWGLAYKPGTDTLRRSSAIELCRWLADGGATVRAHDPAVRALPPDLGAAIELCSSPLEAASDAEALVVCTAWPHYREVSAEELLSVLAQPLVIDPSGALQGSLAPHPEIRHVRVGAPAARSFQSQPATISPETSAAMPPASLAARSATLAATPTKAANR